MKNQKKNTKPNESTFAKKRGKFLRTLGAESDQELHEAVLTEAFYGDNFEGNIAGVFANHYNEKGYACEDFYSSFLDWGKQNVDEAFKLRWKVAKANTIGLCGAFALNFVHPAAGISIGLGVSAAAGVAEGVAKRNVASFGHLEDHFAQKMHSCVTHMAKGAHDFLTKEAQKRLDELCNPKSKAKKSAAARMFSYFSGPVVSGINSLVSRFVSVPVAAAGVVGSVVPVLPLATVALSRKAANLRHESALAKSEFFHDVVEVLFDENSWANKALGAKKIDELSSQFALDLAHSDNHGRMPEDSKFHKAEAKTKDVNTNVKKGITFLPWLGARVNKFIKRKILKQEVRDIAEYPAGGVKFVTAASYSRDSAEEEKGAIDLVKSPTLTQTQEVEAREETFVEPLMGGALPAKRSQQVRKVMVAPKVPDFVSSEQEDVVEYCDTPGVSSLSGIRKLPIDPVKMPERDVSEGEAVLKSFMAQSQSFRSHVGRDASSSFRAVGPASNLSISEKGVQSKSGK